MDVTSTAAAPDQDLQTVSPASAGAPPGERRPVAAAAVARASRDLLLALGADLDSEALRQTPRRMAAAYLELLTPEPFNLTTFPNDEGYDELVLVATSRSSLCACTTCFPFMASLTSPTCRPIGSSACPSSPAWLTSS